MLVQSARVLQICFVYVWIDTLQMCSQWCGILRAVSYLGVAVQVYTDNHVSTKFYWARPHMLSPESTAIITWDIPEGTPAGAAPLHTPSSSLLSTCTPCNAVWHACVCPCQITLLCLSCVFAFANDQSLSGRSPWYSTETLSLS